MKIFLQNTLTGNKEEFKPLKEGFVSMYNCGPTVYDYAHIGNFRTFIMGDILRRVFEYNGFSVNQVMNITDVDDKTIRRSREENVSLDIVTRKYEDLFFKDLESLNILKPKKTPRATDNIKEMIDMINTLLEKGVAYKSTDGIYFDIVKSKNYGRLAKLDLNSITKERISNDEYDKSNPRDFSLWKFHSEEDGDVFYEAPFGKGRPGWHIECSAMSINELGETIDVHTGGQDLIFPHHTNEIAQSECTTGQIFVNYWVHGGFITIDGQKMSKSKGNIYTLENLREKNIDPLSYRYFTLGSHYSTLLNFTLEGILGAQTALKRLREKINYLPDNGNVIETDFKKFVNDDLDMPKSLALVWDILKDEKISDADKKATILDFDKVLGLDLGKVEDFEIPENVKMLIEKRDKARAEKNFLESDKLRLEIETLGYVVKDTESGSEVKPK